MVNRIYVQPKPPYYLTVIFQDVFHLKSLYIAMHLWCVEEGWTSKNGRWEDPYGDDKCETMFYDNRSKGNRKLWIWWRLQKPTGNSYYQYFMNINFMFLGWRDVETMHEGTKYKAQYGELTILIRPWIEYDYKDQWAKHSILKYFNNLFQKRVYKEDMLKREDMLLQDAYRLQSTIKNFLNQKKFMPDSEILFEPRRKFG